MGDLLTLLMASNPLGTVTKSVSQFQRGIDDLLGSLAQFNATLEQFNIIASRVNRLLDDVEPPVRALMPQVTRTIQAADVLVTQLTSPIERVAPALGRLADTLDASPLDALPRDLGAVVDLLSELVRRLQPLGQLAESAGGLLGIRSLGSLFGGNRLPEPEPTPPATAAPKPAPAKRRTTQPAPAKRPATTPAPAKKAAAKQTATKKPGAKR